MEAMVKHGCMTVPFASMLAFAVFAKHALAVVNKKSPYDAVMGLRPSMLHDVEITCANPAPYADDESGRGYVRSEPRMLEIPVQSIVEGTAQECLARAHHSKSRTRAQNYDSDLRRQVEIYVAPEHNTVNLLFGTALAPLST